MAQLRVPEGLKLEHCLNVRLILRLIFIVTANRQSEPHLTATFFNEMHTSQ